jgi:hypothetical protein
MIETVRIRWAVLAAYVEGMINAREINVGNSEEKRSV